MSESTPRIPPLAPREWPAEMRDALEPLRPPVPRDPSRPKGLNVLGLMAWHPALAKAYHLFTQHVLYASTLSARQRELLVLRTAALRQAEYEWAQHAATAGEAGITPDEVERVTVGPHAAGWTPFEAALLSAADELVTDALISDHTWAVLAAELDERQLLDVVFTVGCYETLAMAMRSAGLQLDDDLR